MNNKMKLAQILASHLALTEKSINEATTVENRNDSIRTYAEVIKALVALQS